VSPTPDCEILAEFDEHRCGGTLDERGTRAALTTKSPGRAFRFDTPQGRRALGLADDSPCADGGLWLPQRDPPTAVVAELKSGSAGNAEQQLTVTTKAVVRLLASTACDVEVVGLLCLSGGAPVGQAETIVRFRRATGRTLRVKSGVTRALDVLDALGD
jgi:hypothetical protein